MSLVWLEAVELLYTLTMASTFPVISALTLVRVRVETVIFAGP